MCGGCGSRGVRTDRDDSCMRVQLNVCVWTVTVTTNSFEKYGCTWGSRRVSSRSRLGDAYRIAARRAARRLTHVRLARIARTLPHTPGNTPLVHTACLLGVARRRATDGAAHVQTSARLRHHTTPAVDTVCRGGHIARLSPSPSILLPSATFARRQHAPRLLSLGAHAASLTLRPLLRNCAIAASLFSRCARAASPAARSAAIFAGSATTSTFACVGSSP